MDYDAKGEYGLGAVQPDAIFGGAGAGGVGSFQSSVLSFKSSQKRTRFEAPFAQYRVSGMKQIAVRNITKSPKREARCRPLPLWHPKSGGEPPHSKWVSLGSGLLDNDCAGLAYVGIVNLVGVELQVAFQNQIH